ncbi:MAG: hypothetical protein J6U20_01765 [Fibrobacter sp.]|nr:hypothetical protein [Fibrobacter sp.]
MKKKLLFLCGLLAFWACSDDKSVDVSSSENIFRAFLNDKDGKEDLDDADARLRSSSSSWDEETSDPDEWDEDFDPDEDFYDDSDDWDDDSDEWDEPSSSSKKSAATRSSSSVEKNSGSFDDPEISIEPALSSSSTSGTVRSSSSSSYKDCCSDIPVTFGNILFHDLWNGDFYTVNTDVYADEWWRNRDLGLWFVETDSIDGGESGIVWPVPPGTEYDAASLDPIIEYCIGLCGEFRLEGSKLSYDPYVQVGFFMVGLDSAGKDIAVDVSNWEGICVQYSATVSIMLFLDLGDSVNREVEYDLPKVQLPKSIDGTAKCFLWSDFSQAGWGRGPKITGEQAATQLARVIFKIQAKDGSSGNFNIISLGTVKGNR